MYMYVKQLKGILYFRMAFLLAFLPEVVTTFLLDVGLIDIAVVPPVAEVIELSALGSTAASFAETTQIYNVFEFTTAGYVASIFTGGAIIGGATLAGVLSIPHGQVQALCRKNIGGALQKKTEKYCFFFETVFFCKIHGFFL